MWSIQFTSEARGDIAALPPFARKKIISGIEIMLLHEADRESRNRKRLRLNPLADWEIRIEEYRVFYRLDVEKSLVRIIAVGRKVGSILFIRGERFEL